VRMLPALNITLQQLDRALAILREAVAAVTR
jgi:4-aminobutyrate aminotransferase-like enzyme